MPIYVYKNLTTGERFEIEQRIAEPPLEEHPETGDPVKRLVQPVGIAFKGSGFYKTDSRAKTGTTPKANGSADGGKKDAPAAGASKEGGTSGESAKAAEGGKADTASSSASKAAAKSD